MIRNIFLLMAFFGLAIGANAQNHDTMYIMKDGKRWQCISFCYY